MCQKKGLGINLKHDYSYMQISKYRKRFKSVVERWLRSRAGVCKEQSSMAVQLGKRWVAVIDKVATHQGWPLREVSLSQFEILRLSRIKLCIVYSL